MVMKTPIHLWIVGVLSFLWNSGGAYDYLMTQIESETYLALVTAPQRAFLEAAPMWFEASWAIGVWFAVLGSILLFFRSRLARTCFGFALLGMVASSVYSYGIARPSSFEVSGTAALSFTAAIVLVLILQYFYARVMTRRGVLR
jgi:hypothetical protein